MLDLLVRTAHAQGIDISTTFGPATKFPTIGSLVNVIIKNLLTIAGVLALIFVIVAGFNIITHAGGGESDKLNKDKGAFTAALIGLIIIFGAYFFLQALETLTGYKLLIPNVGP